MKMDTIVYRYIFYIFIVIHATLDYLQHWLLVGHLQQ